MTHLLVVTTNFAETRGGVEGHLTSLLPLLVDRDIDVTVAYLGEPRPPFVRDGVHIVPLARRLDFRDIIAVPDAAQWRRFAASVGSGALPAGPVTHVATHTRFFPMSFLGVRLGHRLGVPVVHTEHGGGFVATSSRTVEWASRAVDLSMGRAVLRGATRVLGVSSVSCEFVRQLSGVSAERFNNGVDIRRWLPENSTVSESPPDDRDLVFVGRLVPEKGWRSFLDIAQRCRERGWAGEVHVLGDGPDRATATAYADTVGLGPIHAPGHVTPSEVREALQGAVYVNPTMASEGFQLTLVEALAAGAGVVTYDVGGTDELSAVPEVSLRVAPRGDVAALGEGTWQLLTGAPPHPSFEQLRDWDWSAVADRYRDILEQVAEPAGLR